MMASLPVPAWAVGYYEGVVDGLDELLELHKKRDTVGSTFGTRSSRLTHLPCTPNSDSNKENEDHKKTCHEGNINVWDDCWHVLIKYFLCTEVVLVTHYWCQQGGIQWNSIQPNDSLTASMAHGTRNQTLQPAVVRTYKGAEKKGCRAHIEITEFILYPEYAVTQTPSKPLPQKQNQKVREEMLRSLQLTLAQS